MMGECTYMLFYIRVIVFWCSVFERGRNPYRPFSDVTRSVRLLPPTPPPPLHLMRQHLPPRSQPTVEHWLSSCDKLVTHVNPTLLNKSRVNGPFCRTFDGLETETANNHEVLSLKWSFLRIVPFHRNTENLSNAGDGL